MNRYILSGILICFTYTVCNAFSSIKYDSLLRIVNYSSDPAKKAECHMELSDLVRMTDFKLSLQHAIKAVDYAKNSKNNLLLGKAYVEIGKATYYCNDFVYSLEVFLKAKEIFINESDFKNLFSTYVLLGKIYSKIYDNNTAMQNYQTAINIYENVLSKTEPSFMISPSVYASIGLNYFNSNDTESAEEYTLKAIELSEKSDSSELDIFYLNLANIQIAKKNFGKAHEILLNTENFCKNKLSLGGLKLTSASLYISSKEYDKALDNIEEVLKIGISLNSYALLKEAYYMRSCINEEFGEYRQALNDYKKSEFYSNYLFNKEKIDSLQQLKYASEFHIREAELIDHNNKTKISAIIIIIISITIVIIVFCSIFIIRSKFNNILSKKNVLEKNLELKNRELISKTLFIIEKNEAINSAINELVSLKNELRNITKKDYLQNCISKLKNVSEENSLSSFETYFNNVYESFYTNLKKDFNELTPSDLRMCALLRLNLTSKEISAILNQSVGSIDVTRSRIRKKLGLTDNNENLVKFLSKY